MSFAFLIVPNFNPFRDGDSMEDLKTVKMPGNSRNLLHKSGDDIISTDDNPYGITVKPAEFWEQPPQTPVLPEFGKPVIQDLDIDGVEEESDKKTVNTNSNEKVVYVQIEKSVVDADMESNVTYVSSEAEYKKDFMADTGGSPVEVNSSEKGTKRKHDL